MALKDFSWEISASVGHYKNEVTALPDNDKTVYTSVYGGEVMTKVGNPVGLSMVTRRKVCLRPRKKLLKRIYVMEAKMEVLSVPVMCISPIWVC